ncbi:c-type cytochrome [Azonexus sp.]|jgi:cytochrome c553|uniref:c-type cytochrome n=1 Tax=Azonexus sp. TaxID=1872668 RepID=UPI00281AF608|nr:c-type cytochrome [Azonexus sp.]MDR1994874.1 c-type cytochrome [Azonexus sp.]
MKLTAPIAALCLLACAGPAPAAGPQLGRNLAATCATCHGTNGRAVVDGGIASLAGVDRERLLQKLAAFRSGEKSATIMQQIAKGFTDDQLDLIATHFAGQK